ncbi:MAG: MFS transporter, partial [Peptococcaceae bacterium]|nr:MFS transporter [Peptococcaceae bacterium]
ALKFDSNSFLLSGLAFGGITLGAGNITNFGISDPFSFVPLFVGLITIVLFTKRQLSMTAPLLDLHLFKNRTFTLATISAMLHNFVMSGSAILIPTLMQTVYHSTATMTGLFMLIPALVFAMVSPVAGKIYDKFGIRNLYIFSSIALFVTHGSMVFATESTHVLLVMAIYALRNAALAVLMMPVITWGMGALPKEQYSQGTAVMNTFKNVAGAIGSAVVIGFMAFITQVNAGNPHADMYGFNGAFAFTTVFTIFMVVIAFIVKPGKE